MTKRVLGSIPPQDPVKEVQQSRAAVYSTSDLKWNDRAVKRSWVVPFLIGLTVCALVVYQVLLVLAVIAVWTLLLSVIPRLDSFDSNDEWDELGELDIKFQKSDRTVLCSGSTNRHVSGVVLDEAAPRLFSDMGRLIRSTAIRKGLFVSVRMKRQDFGIVLNSESLTDGLQEYFATRSDGELKQYIAGKSGIWSSRVVILGQSKTEEDALSLVNEIKGALPSGKWNKIESSILEKQLDQWSMFKSGSNFYASGKELTDWLVQLASELIPEVGHSVPGEFVAPIKRRIQDELIFGRVLNPETLQVGPRAGISFGELRSGLLVTGGQRRYRLNVLAHLIRRLLSRSSQTRVLVCTSREDALTLSCLDEGSVVAVLGKNFVLNPVDSDGINSTRYTRNLIEALDVIAGGTRYKDLTPASDFERALLKAVASKESTIADIRIESEDPVTGAPIGDVSRAGQTGMEAIKSLHEGIGASAFYGTQTLPFDQLVSQRLSILHIDLGHDDLDRFAWDLVSIKSSAKQEEELVIIFDEPKGFLVRDHKYSWRESWVTTLAGMLTRSNPLVMTIDRPSSLTNSVLDVFGSALSMRLTMSQDVRVAQDILGLTVVSSMHSKARQSSRESGYLSTLAEKQALLRRNRSELSVPLVLHETPAILDTVSEAMSRFSDLVPVISEIKEPVSPLGDIDAAGLQVMRLLDRYEPLTRESMNRFLKTSGEIVDIDEVLIRLEKRDFVLRGTEVHSGVSYTNYRLTMKGRFALERSEEAGE